MKKTIGKCRLSYDELQTVLLEIELILNSRPLCYLFDNDEDDVLTPNHMMFGRKLNAVNFEGNFDVNDMNEFSEELVTKRVKYMKYVIMHFWERWRKDYARGKSLVA